MGKLGLAARNFVPNFVIAFAVGSLLRDWKTGLKAGLAFGVVAVVVGLLLSSRAGDVEELIETELDVETEAGGAEA